MGFDWCPGAVKEGALGQHGGMAPTLNTESTSVPGPDGEIGQLPEQQFNLSERRKVPFLMNLFEKRMTRDQLHVRFVPSAIANRLG
jgi:hypothetical protein